MIYKDFFKDKKISVIGLGPHGEMLADIKFLAKNKSIVSVYDMRSESKLEDIASDLIDLNLNKVSYGKINQNDLLDSDLIILSSDISKKSHFLKKAIEAGIQIEYAEILFFKLVPTVTIIGVLGVYGKSTVAHLIHQMLKKSFVDYEDQGLFVIDSDTSNGVLTHLKKIKKGDVVIVRIQENLIPYYHEIRISPHVAVLTSKISSKILEFQTYNNFIIASDNVIDLVKDEIEIRAKILRTRSSSIPSDWISHRKVAYDRENASLALQTSELFKVSKDIAKEVIQGFLGLKGRIEAIKKVNSIEFYNDSSSISPHSTILALKSLSNNKNISIIIGGSYTGHDYNFLLKELSNYVKNIIVLPGSGTIGYRSVIDKINEVNVLHAFDIDDAVSIAFNNSSKGDIVLFSPAFDAVGIYNSRKHRGEVFVRAIRNL